MAKKKKKSASQVKDVAAQGTKAARVVQVEAAGDREPSPGGASSPRCRFVVGIGASAGGLQSLERFFDNMPPDSGLAFV
ncbi:MAG: chemotaxis protein CheB, partial [Planctomycetota bacterium]